MQKRLFLWVAVLAGGLVLMACGSGSNPAVTLTPMATLATAPTLAAARASTVVVKSVPTLAVTSVPTRTVSSAATHASSGVAPTSTQIAKGDADKGKALFVITCAVCHGPEGKGVKGLGKDMTASKFIASKSDEEMLAFLQKGRPTDDPLNTTGVMMPPKGGNPSLTDAQLRDIIAFVRTINKLQ